MDSFWGDTIFDGVRDFKKHLISYLGTIYLTGSTRLVESQGPKFRETLKSEYLDVKSSYDSEDLKRDFNSFYYARLFIDKLVGKKIKGSAIEVVADLSASYIKKSLFLAYALNFKGVIPGVSNLVISSALAQKNCCSVDFFEKIMKKDCEFEDFQHIDKVSFYIFKAMLATKDFTYPRHLASNFVIKSFYANSQKLFNDNDYNSFKLTCDQLENFDKWLSNWQFSQKDLGLRVRALFIILLGADVQNGELVIDNKFPTGVAKPSELNLDHLEPNTPNNAFENAYFQPQNSEDREYIVNGLGNMMLLDRKTNIQKTNNPLCGFFDLIKSTGLAHHWLISEIKAIFKIASIKTGNNLVPTGNFFRLRSKRLREIMGKIISADYNRNKIKIGTIEQFIKKNK